MAGRRLRTTTCTGWTCGASGGTAAATCWRSASTTIGRPARRSRRKPPPRSGATRAVSISARTPPRSISRSGCISQSAGAPPSSRACPVSTETARPARTARTSTRPTAWGSSSSTSRRTALWRTWSSPAARTTTPAFTSGAGTISEPAWFREDI